MKRYLAIAALLCATSSAASSANPVAVPGFKYKAPGAMPSSQGRGRVNDRHVYAPGIEFPIRFDARAGESVVLNSQVYGDKSWQCKVVNYSMPWGDTFCESRSWPMGLCPTNAGHQGVDIRPVRCRNDETEVVAVEDGKIDRVTSHTTVGLAGDSGLHWRYMHMSAASIAVRPGQRVRKGQVLGRVSNIMKGKPNTTYHLHLDVSGNLPGGGNHFLPPYTSMVASYRRALGLPDAVVDGKLTRDPEREL
jgi:murein DD-endopeptidase MepM/ murein hydrolase activator NlpD